MMDINLNNLIIQRKKIGFPELSFLRTKGKFEWMDDSKVKLSSAEGCVTQR